MKIFYLSIKFDYVLIEVVVFKVFDVDRLKGLVLIMTLFKGVLCGK